VLRFLGCHHLGAHLRPISRRVLITYTMGFLTRTLRDPSNWQPSAKAWTDGLVDAGVLPGDDYTWVAGPLIEVGPLSPEVTKWPRQMRRVQVTVTITNAVEAAA
jgi:hypothetical protein